MSTPWQGPQHHGQQQPRPYPEQNLHHPYPQGPPSVGMAPLPGTSTLLVNLQGSPLTSSMITPDVLIDGVITVGTKYGLNHYPVTPGRHRIEVRSQWMRTFGQAEVDVAVPPGGVVQLFYAAPLHQFSRGNMGFEPQPRPGMLVFWLMMAGLAMLLVLPIVIAVLVN